MPHAMIARITAMVELKVRRAVMSATASVFLLVAFGFALSAGWLWLAPQIGAMSTNLVFAAAFAVIGLVVLLLARPSQSARVKATPTPAPVTPPPPASMTDELIAAFAAGSQIGRSVRR